jgi:hypothetical protein
VQGFGWQFEPRYEARPFTPQPRTVNSRFGLLSLNADLLEVFSIAVGSDTPTYGVDVVPHPNDGTTPIRTLRLVNPLVGPIRSWYPTNPPNSNWIDSVVITGLWGMRTDYASYGFFDSGVICPGITAGATTMIVSDVAGPDLYGRVPRFSPGNLIRLDNELIEVTAVDTATKTLSLARHARNSIAAVHNAGIVVYLWEPEPDITQVVTRQACLLYARRGAYGVLTMPDGSSISYPNDLLAELRATVNRFSYTRAQ